MFARTASKGRFFYAKWLKVLDSAIYAAIMGHGPDRLLVNVPPRHGKSELLSKYLPAWYLSTFPDRRIICASHTALRAKKLSGLARDVFEANAHRFGLRISKDTSAKADWAVADHDGGLFAGGVDSPVTGEGANLIIVDDPHKDQKEAESQVERDNIWDWYTSTLYTRQNPGGCVIVVIQTRWHEDDLTGRLLAAQGSPDADQWRHIKFPAIAEMHDELGRAPGEVLFPELKPMDELLRIRANMTSRAFASQFQQRPMPLEGGMFQKHWFAWPEKAYDGLPDAHQIGHAVRYWDLAYSDGKGDNTCGALLVDVGPRNVCTGRLAVADVITFQKSGHERNQIIAATADSDRKRFGHKLHTYIEQDGHAGKEVVQEVIRALSGHSVRAVLTGGKGSKAFRADPFAAQCEAGNVRLVRGGDWQHSFLDELCAFPFGKNDDQVDAVAGAFSRMPKPGSGAAPFSVPAKQREFAGHARQNPRRFLKA